MCSQALKFEWCSFWPQQFSLKYFTTFKGQSVGLWKWWCWWLREKRISKKGLFFTSMRVKEKVRKVSFLRRTFLLSWEKGLSDSHMGNYFLNVGGGQNLRIWEWRRCKGLCCKVKKLRCPVLIQDWKFGTGIICFLELVSNILFCIIM